MPRHVPAVVYLIIALIGAFASAATSAAAVTPPPGSPTPVVAELDNGLTLVVLEHRAAPVVTVQGWVPAGSATEEERTGAGLSHFLEHMLFKGTPTRDVGEMGRQVKAIGGYTNAYTTHDRTVYYINCDASGVNEALAILTDVLNNASFDPAEIAREREVIVKEMNRARDNPRAWLSRTLWREAFRRHPYGHPVIGYETPLRQVTRDDLLAYYARHYVPNNITLVVVGDVDGPAVIAETKALWADVPRASYREPVRAQEPAQLGPRERIEVRDARLAHVNIAYHGPALADPDMYPMDVLSLILGSGRTSRLYRAVREEQELVHDISSYSHTPRDPGLFALMMSADPPKREAAIAAALAEVERIKARGVTRREVDTAKRKVIAGYYQGRETAEQLAAGLGTALLVAGDLHFDETYVSGIQAVTAAEVQRVARVYLTESNRTMVAVVPETDSAPADEPPLERAVGDVKLHTLDNGIRVVVRENHTMPLVSVRALVLGGLRSDPPDRPGTTNLMSQVLTQGTRRWDGPTLAEVVESRGGRFAAFGGNNSWGASVSMLSDDQELAFTVLDQLIRFPTFPDAAVARERASVLAGIRAQDEDVATVARREVRQRLYRSHPYRWLTPGSAEAVAQLTAGDLRAHHARLLDPERMVVAVVGDVTVRDAVTRLNATLGRIQPPAERWAPPAAPEFSAAGGRHVEKAWPSAQTVIIIAYPGIEITDPRRATLSVISESLNGQGGRLFHALRDEQGLAYAVGFGSTPGLDRGLVQFYIATTVDQRQAALAGLRDQIARLRETGLTPEEIADARRVLISSQARAMQTNADFGFTVGLDTLYGLGPTHYAGLADRLARVTPASTRQLAQEVFAPALALAVEVGPPAD